MKKIISALLLMTPVLLSAQKDTFLLKGKIGNLNAPSIAYLRYSLNGVTIKDSSLLTNGNFNFKGTLDQPVAAFLTLSHDGLPSLTARNADAINLYLEKGNIVVYSKDSLSTSTITGSQLNLDNQRLQTALKPLTISGNELNTQYSLLTAEQKKDTLIRNSFIAKDEALRAEQNVIIKQFIHDNPNSLISLFKIRNVLGPTPDYQEAVTLFTSLSPDIQNSIAGKKYASYLDQIKSIAIGNIAPDFVQNNPDGLPVKLSSFRGKYLLLDFWASWCGPCREENPNVVKAYNTYKDKNFTILSVSLDQPGAKDKWLKAIENDHLTWTHISDLAFWNNAVAKQYAIQSIPQNFLLDPTGKIIAKNLRGEDLQKKLAEIL